MRISREWSRACTRADPPCIKLVVVPPLRPWPASPPLLLSKPPCTPRLPQDLTFRHYTLKLKIASDTYNDEQKVRVTVTRAEPPNFVQESKVRPGWGGRACSCQREGVGWVVAHAGCTG